ncbi:hypothetical protein [Streptomyces sp. NPDC059466]|uniref:hypothetical protein n=1 Tax=unclassified Streptomyces TaxID=2593676 RepID=UPI00368BA0C5
MPTLVSFTRRADSRVIALTLLALLMSLPAGTAQAASPEAHPPKDDPGYVVQDLKVVPATADYDHRTVTVSGTLAIDGDRPGPRPPAPGQTVDLVEWGVYQPDDPDPTAPRTDVFDRLGTVTTDAQGHFRLANAVIDQRIPDPLYKNSVYTVHVYAMRRLDPAVYGSWGAHADASVTCTASPTRFRGDYKVGPKTGDSRKVTAEGYWERKDGGTWKPFKGGKVRVTYQPAKPGSTTSFEGTTTTGADGHFSVTFTATADGEAASAAYAIPDADASYVDAPEDSNFTQVVNVSQADPTSTQTASSTPTASPTPSHHATAGPSTSGAPTPGQTPAPDNTGALATTGTDSSTPLIGLAALVAAGAGTAFVTAGRRKARRH